MRLNILGALSLTTENRPSAELSCSSRAALLLASLALSETPQTRSVLLERLWPEDNGRVPRSRSDRNLDGYATEARKLLGDLGKALHADKGAHTLTLYRPTATHAPATIPTDIYEFQQLVDSDNETNAEAALALVRGPILASLDSHTFPWLAEIRQKFAKDCSHALRKAYSWTSSRAELFVTTFMRNPSGSLLDAALTTIDADSEEPSSPTDLSLTAYYRDNSPNLHALKKLVIPSAPPFYDADITIMLKDGRSSERYELTYGLEITASLDSFILAFTTRASVTDLLLAECPDISDSFTCSTAKGRRSLLKSLSAPAKSPITVQCLQSDARGVTRRSPIQLVELNEAERLVLLKQLDAQALNDVVLVRGRMPGTRGSERRISYRVCDSAMSVKEHYAFWVADRPTFVRRIHVDATNFAPNVHIHPMLGNISHEWEWESAQCDTLVNNWVVKNQGIFLSW